MKIVSKNIIKNEYVVSIVSKVFVVLVGILYSSLFARYCGPTIKGEIAYINSYTAIGSIVITFGLHQAYPYYRKKYGGPEYRHKFFTIVFFIFANYVLLSFILVSKLYDYISIEWVSAIILMPIIGYSCIVCYVALVENPNLRNGVFLIIHVVELAYVVFLFFFTKATFLLALSSFALAEILKSLVYTIILKIKPAKFSFRHALELYKYGFFPMVGLLMTSLNYRIDVIMLRNSPNITAADVGIYSVGINLAEKVLLFPDSIKQVLMSKLAKGKDEKEVAKVSRICFFVSFICAICLIALGKLVLGLLYGKEYLGAYYVVIISVIGTTPMVFYKMIGQYNIINKKQIYNVLMLSLSIVINVLLNLLLVPWFGIEGAATATAIGHFVCSIVFILYFSRKTRIGIHKILFIQKDDINFLIKAIRKKD